MYAKKLSDSSNKIFDYIEKNPTIFSYLFKSKLFPEFQQQLSYAIEDLFSKEKDYIDDSHVINKDLYYRAICCQLDGILQWWVEQNFKFSSTYMVEQFASNFL